MMNGIIAAAIALPILLWFLSQGWEVTSHEKAPGDDYVIRLKNTLGRRMTVRGSGTVWSRYPSGQRVGTSKEHMLANIWQRLVWDEEEDGKCIC